MEESDKIRALIKLTNSLNPTAETCKQVANVFLAFALDKEMMQGAAIKYLEGLNESNDDRADGFNLSAGEVLARYARAARKAEDGDR